MPSIFDNLPFTQAINALMDRLAIPKRDFLELDAQNRSRAFTMARISDLELLQNIHDELSIAINNGETWPQFQERLMGKPGIPARTSADGTEIPAELAVPGLADRSGWTGTSPWHHRLVYDQNLSMAYSAGRVEQGMDSGLRVWRYLPSMSMTPRPDHEKYYGNLYRMEPGSPTPPIDFNCGCGWEWVLPHELDAMGVDPADLDVFDPPVPKSGFVWSPTAYFDLKSASEMTGRMPVPHSALSTQHSALILVPCSGVWSADDELNRWSELATEAASKISQGQFERFAKWASTVVRGAPDSVALQDLLQRVDDALPVIKDDDQAELDAQVTMAAMLRGRVTTKEVLR